MAKKYYKIEKEIADELFEKAEELQRYLTERISDLHEVQGGMQARHAYVFYREFAWDIMYGLRDNLKPLKKKDDAK